MGKHTNTEPETNSRTATMKTANHHNTKRRSRRITTTLTPRTAVVKPVDFSHVEAVANGWMLDFWFVSLCRYFKEDKLDEFNETLSTFEANDRGHSQPDRVQKRMICAFLARIMHGKQLDVQFEMDDRVMPLMSAADIWLNMRDTVAGEKLFEDITNLLLVQSVAVCLDNGQRSKASSALKWFEKKNDLPQKLRLKLSTIVAQRDTYHPLLLSYTFPRLLETVESYVDAFLEKNPSDYLLQAAMETVQSSQNTEATEDSLAQDEPLSETTENVEKTKRRIQSDSCQKQKPAVVLRALSKNVSPTTVQQGLFGKSPQNTWRSRRKPQKKWTYQLDQNLKHGIKRHGTGKWARILLDYDFEGRTGTQLKDRWRVLKRNDEVS